MKKYQITADERDRLIEEAWRLFYDGEIDAEYRDECIIDAIIADDGFETRETAAQTLAKWRELGLA